MRSRERDCPSAQQRAIARRRRENTLRIGLRPIGKPLDRPPDPTVACAPHFYPDRFLKLVLPQADSNIGAGGGGHRRPKGAAFSNEVAGRSLGMGNGILFV